MARWNRRRRYNGTWFPVQPGSPGPSTLEGVVVNWDGTTVLNAYAILPGSEPFNTASGAFTNPAGLGASLRQSYVLKRIVGQLHCALRQGGNPTTSFVLTAEVRAGLFVDRVDDTGVLQNLNAWDPFQESAKQKRWLWQRSWVLNDSVATASIGGDYYDFPNSNAEYNSALSNGNIDWKGGARVTYEERPFLMVATKCVDRTTGDLSRSNSNVVVAYNLRILGKPSSRNNR